MGNFISTSSKLAPISAASTIIGFVSFIFTLLTALRVFWTNLSTFVNANSDVGEGLLGLKQSLIEEKAALRLIRRRCPSQFQEGAFSLFYLAVREMLDRFAELEGPFRVNSSSGSGSGKGNGNRARSRGSRRRSGRKLEDGDMDGDDDYYGCEYEARSLAQRWSWLYRRSKFQSLSDRLTRLQERRVARQVATLAVESQFTARSISELQDRIDDLENRNGRNRRTE